MPWKVGTDWREKKRKRRRRGAAVRGDGFGSWIFRGKAGWRRGVGAGFLERKLRRG